MSVSETPLPERIYRIVFPVLTVALGLLFLLCTVSVYRTGTENRQAAAERARQEAIQSGADEETVALEVAKAVSAVQIYSRENVGKTLFALLPAVCVWLAALLFGVVLQSRSAKQTPKKAPVPLYMKAERKPGGYRAFRRQFALHIGITAGIGVLLSLLPLFYLTDGSHFPNNDLNGEVVRGMLFSLPFLLGMLLLAIAYMLLRERKLTEFLQAEATADPDKPAESEKHFPTVRVLRILLLCCGIALTVLGVFNGSMQEVLIKATKICTECIGLG